MEKLPEFQNSSLGGGGLFSFSEDDDDGGAENINEELVEKVMQELKREINACYSDDCFKNTLPSPASLPVFYPPSPAFVVVGGDNERCGPAFSGSTASMMVGVGVVDPSITVAGDGGGKVGFAEVAGNGSWVVVEEGEGNFMQGDGGEKMDGCDGGEVEDEWLTRVLSWGPQEFEDIDKFDLS